MRLTAARLLMGVAAAVLLAIASTADARDRGLGAQLGLPPAGLTARPYDRGLSPSDAARVAQQQNGGGRVLSVDLVIEGIASSCSRTATSGLFTCRATSRRP